MSPTDPLLPRISSLLKALRVGSRLARGFVKFWCFQQPDFTRDSPQKLLRRARELQRLCQDLLERLTVELKPEGSAPQSGLLVSNHVSFADILVLGSISPTVFVSKSEVAHWPVIGSIAAAAGTIFIQRQRRTDVARANLALHRTIEAGLLVTLFPEGTSSDGQQVLPFQPSLLQPAIETRAPVTPAFLQYRDPLGQRVDEVAYFGDRHLQDCLWALVQRRQTTACIRFGSPAIPDGDRKSLALSLHSEVRSLCSQLSPIPSPR